MAAITSLGIHKPTGLQYLTSSGDLPQTPRSDDYQWKTYVSETLNGSIEEEVLYNKRCVVWSTANTVRAVYQFDLEGEDIRQAFLTIFPTESAVTQTESQHRSASDATNNPASDHRALTVVFKSKLHIYFLHGAHHVVDLPFAVGNVLPAPQGVVLSKVKKLQQQFLQTPRAPPAAPPNSFFSSQLSMRTSQALSPTLQKSLGKVALRNGYTTETQLDELWQGIVASPSRSQQDDEDTIFTLVNPFSEPGVVTEASRSPAFRLGARSRQTLDVDFDALDPAESIVYISPKDELQSIDGISTRRGPLILIVTSNEDRGTLTLWHGWYLKEKSLTELVKKRNESNAEKARRRSSFLSGSVGTGATTPAVRNRETLRESFVTTSQLTGTKARKATKATDEATMASQLDPDFTIEGTQTSTKDVNRRISSLVSRAEPLLPSNTNASFGASSYRRGTSFGGPNERRSYGLRRSRGSTPGSVLSRSYGVDEDDMMDFENESELDLNEAVKDSTQIIRATYDATGAETLLGTIEGGWKRDLVVQRVHTFTTSASTNTTPKTSQSDVVRLVYLQQPQRCTKSDDTHATVYLHDAASRSLLTVHLQIKHQALYPENASSLYVAVPIVRSHTRDSIDTSIIPLAQGGTNAVLLGSLSIRFSGSQTAHSVINLHTHRLHNPYVGTTETADVGRNRTVIASPKPHVMLHTGLNGRFDISTGEDVLYRQALRVAPVELAHDAMLQVCEVVLPTELANNVRSTWFVMHQALSTRPEMMTGTACTVEAVAVGATILSFVLGLLDQRSKAAMRLAQVTINKQSSTHRHELDLRQHERIVNLETKSMWAALDAGRPQSRQPQPHLDQALPIAIALADDVSTTTFSTDLAQQALIASKLMLGLHIFAEESMLDVCAQGAATPILSPVIAQLGQWLNLDAWSGHKGSYYELGAASAMHWSFVPSTAYRHSNMEIMETPIGVFEWLEHSIAHKSSEQYPTLSQISGLGFRTDLPHSFITATNKLTARITMLSDVLKVTQAFTVEPKSIVEAMSSCNVTIDVLESLPEGLATPMKEAIAQCERNPPGSWSTELLRLVGRDDLISSGSTTVPAVPVPSMVQRHDVHTACIMADIPATITKTREADRNAISQLVFPKDRRLVDAAGMLHFNTVQIAQCVKQADWSDAHYFEQQRRVMQFVTVRMISLPVGDGILHYNSQSPLMTERYHLPGFSSSCIMQPIGHTVTTDRSGLTEEKVNWAYFHAGVSTGLRISKNATGIDTSWLVFNKPAELTNRHAGLLLALGLNGHLKHLAKWLSFKYLTPKHSMTSLGLLLGLAASNLGSMDGLITRMLSVHISCMLPMGAAELNVSPLTQTAGLLGIGLLYFNTQHRRMTETMLSEIETAGVDDPDSGPDASRDESYRLAAGFALGFINLGRSKDLRGLHGVQLQERLLRVAVGPRPIHAVHVLDQATAGATMAIAMVYMKSRDAAIARQIDVPDTFAQFENVRPDILMLRILAKHIIIWDSIQGDLMLKKSDVPVWIPQNLPRCYKSKWTDAGNALATLSSLDLPFYYILTGLGMAMGLRHAGSGHRGARNEILGTLDRLRSIQKKTVDSSHFYDTKMARSAIRRCIDVLALAAATVMSGTGDLQTFRYLRRLHGRTDADTPYGSHLACHMAVGILFMAGGTCTFGTSDLAIASLMVSLYPLFPTDVHDNKVHLQAFRHLWVFAVEPRCLIVEDIDSGRPVKMPIILKLRDGRAMKTDSPCLLPDLATITSITTEDPAYWRIILNFSQNAEQLHKFKLSQKISVRRCPSSEAYDRTFWATFAALSSHAESQHNIAGINGWILAKLRDIDRGALELVLSSEERGAYMPQGRGTKIDDGLILRSNVNSSSRDKLWDLRVLLAWAKRLTTEGHGNTRWLGRQLLAQIECDIDERRSL